MLTSESGSVIFQFVLIIFLTMVNAFFASAEMAMVSMSASKINRLANDGDERAKLLQKLTGNPIFSVDGSAESGYEAFEAGYEDYGSADYRGVGWNEAYAVQEKSATAITMAAKLRGGLTFTRRIELLPKRHAFRVTSSLSGASVKKAVFRTHPTFYTPDATRVSLRWRLGDGSWEEYRIPPSAVDGEAAQLWLRGDKLPAGQWAIVDPVLKRALVNTFDPAEVSVCYANWNKSLNRCNPEQWSRAVDADATSGPTITNTYEFLPEGRYPW